MLEVDRELVDAEVSQLLEAGDVLARRAEEAEAVDDLVGHELGMGVAGPTVLVVVVALAALDVVGQRRRNGGTRPVPRHDVGHVVADHAAEPAALVAHVVDVVADVRGGGDAEGDGVGVAPGVGGGDADGVDRPRGDVGVGELEDEPVADLAGQCQRLRSVCRDPDVEFAGLGPREAQVGALVLDGPAVAELADHVDGLAQRRERRRLAVEDPHGGVAAADSAHGPIPVHVVEGGEQAGRDGPVARRRVGHHRPDDHLAGLGEDLAVDDEGLLPEDVAVERPDVVEPEVLGSHRELDHPRGGRVRLQHHSEVHVAP